jgi:hypothetical protein
MSHYEQVASFKVGDRVRYVGRTPTVAGLDLEEKTGLLKPGAEGTVIQSDEAGFRIKFKNGYERFVARGATHSYERCQ